MIGARIVKGMRRTQMNTGMKARLISSVKKLAA